MSTARSNAAKTKAKTLLGHYLTLMGEKSGVRMDMDTAMEIGEIVECIVEAAVEETMVQIMESAREIK